MFGLSAYSEAIFRGASAYAGRRRPTAHQCPSRGMQPMPSSPTSAGRWRSPLSVEASCMATWMRRGRLLWKSSMSRSRLISAASVLCCDACSLLLHAAYLLNCRAEAHSGLCHPQGACAVYGALRLCWCHVWDLVRDMHCRRAQQIDCSSSAAQRRSRKQTSLRSRWGAQGHLHLHPPNATPSSFEPAKANDGLSSRELGMALCTSSSCPHMWHPHVGGLCGAGCPR